MKRARDSARRGGRTRAIHDYYEHRIRALRAGHRIVDWASRHSQEARFRVLVEAADLEGKSLLDVGCGAGDLLGYLRRLRIGADYTGVDLIEKMVRAARRRHPGGRFLRADVFAEAPFPANSFDVVFCSGTFNLNLGNNRAFLASALPRLLRLCRRCLVVNLLHARAAAGVQEQYFHFDPEQVMALARALPCEAELIEGYLPNDFTVVCRKRPAEPS
jgi:SAM-dependent methyltransferase